MRKIHVENGKPIPIGRLGENETTAVVFNVREWIGALVKDDAAELLQGDYLNPIPYAEGMPVEAGRFYALEDGNIWECIKTDATSHMTTEWFDIIST